MHVPVSEIKLEVLHEQNYFTALKKSGNVYSKCIHSHMISSLTFSHSSTYIDCTRAKNEGGGVGWVDLGGGGEGEVQGSRESEMSYNSEPTTILIRQCENNQCETEQQFGPIDHQVNSYTCR